MEIEFSMHIFGAIMSKDDSWHLKCLEALDCIILSAILYII